MEYAAGDLCPVCESGNLEEKVKDLEFEYNERKSVARDITCFECPVCGESFTNRKDSRSLEKFLTDERRIADGLLVSDEIRKIREGFNLTQVQFAKALKVGEKNFARYESGQTTQGVAMDNLLRVLREYPSAIKLFIGEWKNVEEGKVIHIEALYRKKKARKMVRKVDYNIRQCSAEPE